MDLTLPQLRKDMKGHAISGMIAHLTGEPLLEELIIYWIIGVLKSHEKHAKAEKVSSCSWMSQHVSTKVCFICALHLCNEKNLELKTDPANPLGDFAIVAHS